MEAAAYERAACGLLTTNRAGLVLAANDTLLGWLGLTREQLVESRSFVDLLTGGARIYHETHYAPMLTLQGWAREIAFDLLRSDGTTFPVLINARLDADADQPVVQIAVFDATERRMYERELLAAKELAERSEQQARVLARTLQDTLLPHRVPTVPRLDIAAVYLAAGAGHEIGGDFYDVFQIAADDWVIALGDVEGKGVQAAMVTALVRYTIRAASVEHEPSGVLRIVNDVLLMDETERYCTAVVLRCRRAGDGWAVTFASGGHPLPIRVDRHGAEPVGRPGSLLGMYENVAFTDTVMALADDEYLVVYTDGVTEARNGRELLGEARLERLAASRHGGSASDMVDAIVEEALRYGGTPNRDDIAVICIHPVALV